MPDLTSNSRVAAVFEQQHARDRVAFAMKPIFSQACYEMMSSNQN
jgi:hypothetical protein